MGVNELAAIVRENWAGNALKHDSQPNVWFTSHIRRR